MPKTPKAYLRYSDGKKKHSTPLFVSEKKSWITQAKAVAVEQQSEVTIFHKRKDDRFYPYAVIKPRGTKLTTTEMTHAMTKYSD